MPLIRRAKVTSQCESVLTASWIYANYLMTGGLFKATLEEALVAVWLYTWLIYQPEYEALMEPLTVLKELVR